MSSFYDDASWLLIPSGIEEDVVFAQKPTSGLGDLSFSRASDATYTDSTGVVRRSPYNLLQFSEMFSDGVYTKVATTITANTIVAPNGTLTADKLVSTSASSSHYVYQNLSSVGDIRTISCFVKKAEYRYVNIQYGTATTRFDFDTLTFSGGTGNSYIDAGNGWYRISSILTATVNARASIAIPDNSGNISYVGDNVSGTFIWGFQAVEGTSALDYFPTTNRQDVPRIDFRNADGTLSSCGRLLLEPQRTNSIRNSSMVGAVAGSPGTLPTGWISGNAGLTQTIVGIGTENGLPYIDFRYNGTANSTIAFLGYGANTDTAAANGQTWTSTIYAKVIAQPTPPVSYSQTFRLGQAGGTFLSTTTQNFTPTTTLARYVQTVTIANASTLFASSEFYANLTIAATYDFTIRIAAPQMELGAYATTWVPTTTAAVTRIFDGFTRSNIFTNNFITAAGGTWFVDLSNNTSLIRDGFNVGLFISDSSNSLNNSISFGHVATGSSLRLAIRKTISATNTTIYTTPTDSVKVAIKWNGTSIDVFANGVKVVTASAFAITNMNFLGCFASDVPKYINQSVLFPTPLSDAECIQLTTL